MTACQDFPTITVFSPYNQRPGTGVYDRAILSGAAISYLAHDNDYQQEQAASAEAAARRLGVQIRIIYANNDALKQSQ